MSTKNKILDEATLLIQTRGYLWSYEDISQTLGIKKASIHYHFPGKEDLILACTRRYIAAVLSSMAEISRGEASNFHKLNQLIHIYSQAYQSKGSMCLCTMMSASCIASSSELNALLNEFYAAVKIWIKAVLDEGVGNLEFELSLSSEGLAILIINYLQGLLLTQRLANIEPAEFDKQAKKILNFIRVTPLT